MIQVKSAHKPGTVGYIQANRPRFQKFFDCLEQLQVPEGTALQRSSNYNAAHNRNELICAMEGEWHLFLDDDHAFEDNALLRLLDRDVDIITGLYARRYPNFDPTVYYKFDSKEKDTKLYTWEGLSEESGLLEIEACGAGFLLVKKKVFEAMKPPYFRVGGSHWQNWALEQDVIGEDTGFCERAREMGFKVYVDLDVLIGHIPDETILIPMRQPHNKAFNIINQTGTAQVWMMPEQKRERPLIVRSK